MLRLVDAGAHLPAGFCRYRMTGAMTIERGDGEAAGIHIATCPLGDLDCAFPTLEVLSFIHTADPLRVWGLNRYGL